MKQKGKSTVLKNDTYLSKTTKNFFRHEGKNKKIQNKRNDKPNNYEQAQNAIAQKCT